jgi:hypothetical protein
MTSEEEEKAIEEARYLLARLKISSSWSEPPDDPKKELEQTIALIECVFGEPTIYRLIPEASRRRAIAFLKQCRPPKGRRGGRYTQAERDRLIVQTIELLNKKYRIAIANSPTCCCSIIAQVLTEFGMGVDRKTLENIWSNRSRN